MNKKTNPTPTEAARAARHTINTFNLLGPSPDELTASKIYRITTAHLRYQALNVIKQIQKNQRWSFPKACAAAGLNRISVLRWRAAFAAKGFSGLLPQTHLCGRRPAVRRQPGRSRVATFNLICPVRIRSKAGKHGNHALEIHAHTVRLFKEAR